MAKVAINGLGRIGRATLKIILERPELELVAINDLVPPDNLAYLLNYDSVYGRYEKQAEAREQSLVIDGREYPVTSRKEPSELPWKDKGVDVVFECTGIFRTKEGLEKHLKAGARRVVLSAPAKGEDMIPTVVRGVNKAPKDAKIVSCASCTTNCITPVVEVVGRRIGFHKAMLTTIHAYTSSQSIVDGPNKRYRRGRAGAANLVPTSTGAAVATTEVLTDYKGLFNGVAVRAPVAIGSISDITFVMQRKTSVEELNTLFEEESKSERYKGILGVSRDNIVSSDIIRDPRPSVVDLTMTQVVDGDLVKVMSWYDNEWGYSTQMVMTAVDMMKG